MQELVREYLGELRGKQKKRRRVGMAVAAFAVIIVGGVIWGLIQSGIAMTGEVRCGVEEHTHSDACYTGALVCGQEESTGHTHTDACYETQSTLICGLEESEATEESEGHVHGEECYVTEQVLICGQEESAGHTHTDGCYENQLTCGKEEHIHDDLCYIDTDADVEDVSKWDAQYKDVEWKDIWGEDLVTAAKIQVGYKESTKNYAVAEDGSHKGYTRYGQFAGDAYVDWDAAFVNFCMHYAGLEVSNLFPNEKSAVEWYNKFTQANETNQNYITAPEGYEPEAGDIIFFNKEGEEAEFQMGVVSSYNNEKNEIEVIEGNSGNEVKENKYDVNDSHIHSYLKITELEEVYKDSGEEQVPAEEVVSEEEPGQDAEEERQIFTTETEEWAYNNTYEDDTIVINVSAAEGVVPEGAQLSVTPIEQKEVTKNMTEEEAAEAEKINEQYELTNQKLLEESEKKQETLEGFLAYDICFIVDGEEVEPSGDVKVTMDFKEATKPEGVSENATVAVNHLKEDESAADGIVVEDLTEKEDTTIATADTGVSVEKVELVAESFSTFTITWTWNGMSLGNIEAAIEHISEDGIVLTGQNQKFDVLTSEKKNLLEVLAKQIKKDGITYEPQKVNLFVDNSNVGEVTSVQGNGNTSEIVFYNIANEKVMGVPLWEMNSDKVKLQIVYASMQRVVEGIEIEDNQDGTISVLFGKDSEGKDITELITDAGNRGENVQFIWEKRVGDSELDEFQPVEPKRQGDDDNICADGKTLNIAIDGGGLTDTQKVVRYRVRLIIGGTDEESGGTENDGETEETKKDEEEKEVPEPIEFISPDFLVPYFGELQNGSFEHPYFGGGIEYLQSLVDDLERTAMGIEGKFFGWRTTASDNRIEIASSDGKTIHDEYSQAMPFAAAEGRQFVELNATEVGSLYQDVLTSKGTSLNYYFSHRARVNVGTYVGKTTVNGVEYDDYMNKMYVVIVPTSIAEGGINSKYCHCSDPHHEGPIDTQEEVLCLIANQCNYKNVLVKESEALNSDWTGNGGVYTPQSYLTRFFFVSNELAENNAAGKASHGNFIDNVWFSQKIPTANQGKFNIWIEKTISGDLSNSELAALKEKLTFDISVKDSNGKDASSILGSRVTEIKGNADGWQWNENEDGSITGTYIYSDIDIPVLGSKYTISVTESNEDVTGYTVKPVLVVEGGTVSKDKKSTIVGEKDTACFSFTNPYISEKVESDATKQIDFAKIWEDFGAEGGTRPENLTITLNGKYTNEKQEEVNLTEEDLKKLAGQVSQIVNADNAWKCTWTNVQVYYNNNPEQPITWFLTESSEDSKFVQYQSSEDVKVLEEAEIIDKINDLPECERNEKHTITNTLNGSGVKWELRKESSSAPGKGLAGASFVLREKGDNFTDIATGSSTDPEGKIIWTLEDKNMEWNSLTGDYVITETNAPEGFLRSATSWEVKLVNGIPNIDTDKYEAIRKDEESDGIVFYIANTPLYSLPESGGSGIYWYMFSGILLMAGAVLITYKKRCREVLRS